MRTRRAGSGSATWAPSLAAALALATQASGQCLCPPEALDPALAADRAAVVFLGTVERTGADREVANAVRQYVASFTIERQWQDPRMDAIDVVTVRGLSCWPAFVVGKRYVVFAFRGDPRTSPHETEGSFYARPCYPSAEAGASQGTIRRLDEWLRGRPSRSARADQSRLAPPAQAGSPIRDSSRSRTSPPDSFV